MDNGGFDDLNGISTRTVSASQLDVHLGNCTSEGDVSVLLVHVHGVCARQVANDDAEVPDSASTPLENLNARLRLHTNLPRLLK